MALQNTATHYGSVSKLFHWTTALLILAIAPLGVAATNAPFETSEQLATKAMLFSIHKTLGVLVFFVASLRILWAISQPKPAPMHPDAKLETFLAEVVHWLLYGSLVLAPLSGWIHHAATTGFAPIWWPFGQSLPFVPKSESVAHLFGSLHWFWTKLMIASVVLHIAGALKHQFIDKDATLKRMWFGSIGALSLPQAAKSITAPVIAIGIFAATVFGAVAMQPEETLEAAPEETLEALSSEWTVESGTIGITIKQFGSEVSGSFEDWTSAINFNPETGTGSVETTIAINSLTLGSVTSQAMGADFFDAETHPTATFVAEITPFDAGAYVASGTLSVKDQSVPVELPFGLEFDGPRAAMGGSLSVNRLDFGVGANMPDETNLAFEVIIDIDLIATFNP